MDLLCSLLTDTSSGVFPFLMETHSASYCAESSVLADPSVRGDCSPGSATARGAFSQFSFPPGLPPLKHRC